MESAKILKYQIIAIIFSLVLGTLLHFTYQWSGKNKIVASFSAVNESVWEHLKLVFFPILVFTIIEYFFLKGIANNFFLAKFIALVFSISFIIIFFYTYTGIIGRNYFLLDILSFILAIVFAEIISYQIMLLPEVSTPILNNFTWIGAGILLLYFVLFTYCTPKLHLFQDPISKQYGIKD